LPGVQRFRNPLRIGLPLRLRRLHLVDHRKQREVNALERIDDAFTQHDAQVLRRQLRALLILLVPVPQSVELDAHHQRNQQQRADDVRAQQPAADALGRRTNGYIQVQLNSPGANAD
jgi:hypothetical protein